MGDNDGWGEVFTGGDSPIGRPVIAINDEKFKKSGAGPGYREKMTLFESMHLLKDVEPVRYNRILTKALRDKKYMNWAHRSYAIAQLHEGETRSFAKWHKTSRLDQIIAGYMLGGDPDLPTMKGWNRNLPIGKDLKTELERLREDLEIR